MGSINTISAGFISSGYTQNAAVSAARKQNHSNQSNQANQSAEPSIRDAVMAAEISRLIKSQILNQSKTAIYAQASALNPSVLSLIRDSV